MLMTKCLPVFIILVICRGSQGWRPEMSPGYGEMYINEGEYLELTCTSPNKMEFYYPKDVALSIVTSTADLEEQQLGNVRKLIFRRSESVHGDTGWYGCADEDIDVIPDVYDQPDITWTYVYVKSNSSYFVQTDNLESFREVSGGTVTIPCRPTSPDYKITLFANEDTEMKIGEKTSYDPRIGFKLKNITLKDSGYFKCVIEDGDTSQEVNYHLLVIRNPVLSDPKIIEDTLRHVTRGQTLYVNCTINVDADIQYVFNWTTPQRSSRITTRQYRNTIGVNKQTTTCELIINDVTDEDEGEYECTITTFSSSKRAKTYITVYDPDVKYINLTSQDKDRYYQKKYDDRIQWVVYVDAYPQPTLKWLNPKGDEILGSWMEPERAKHSISTSSSSTVLRINRLNLNDMGLYSLQATNKDRIETLNFTLEVITKPIPILERLDAFYMPKQKEKISCHVAAFPAPDIKWSFLGAPNYPSFEGSQLLPLKNSSMISKLTSFLSTVSMTIEMSGHLNCTACNTLGCDWATDLILVSDVPGGFGIVEKNIMLAVGDDIELTCAASIYNYTSVEWLNEDDSPIVETSKITITKGKTDFTHRSVLHMKNITKADSESYYVCSAKDVDGFVERSDRKLDIHDPVAPYFYDTNMNKSEVVLDLSTDGHKTVILKCYVSGMPTPSVTWYKDESRISPNEQYVCLHDDQELRIQYLLDENSGKYTCRAENRVGIEENYQILAIKVKEVSKAWIISIVVLVVICIILVIYFSIKMHREKVMRKQLMEAGLTHFEEGALECLNPDLTVDDQAELLPYDKKWEFPRERLKFGKKLGFGAFGVVMKAEAQGICDDEAVTTVAVKMVRRTTESTYIRALASELKIMVHLGKHLNVVNLLGACTKNITKRELLVIVEYCRFGNLHNYLLRHRADFINQIDPATGKLDPTIGFDILTRTTSIGSNNSVSANSCNSNTGAELVAYTTGTDSQGVSMSPDGCVLSNNSTQPGWRSNYSGDYKDQNLKPICTQDLLSWAFQVARGMEYLSQRKVLHGDLAARNILLAENNIVKICDFGLAKTMYKDDNYKKKGDTPLPIKWMAIESIRDRVFSTQSDIWSFGIVLWEFFTLAKTPYPGMDAEKQYQRLIEGYRMEQPEYATDDVYDIMLQCWKAKPTLRPTFTDLVSSIGDSLEDSVKAHYVDLNAPYMDMNTMTLEGGKNDYLTMMSAPDHDALSSPTRDYVNSPCLSPGIGQENDYLPMSPSIDGSESGIFSPRVNLNASNKFEFPSNDVKSLSNVHSDSESEAVELSPMLKNDDDDNYLKPINVHERRAEFARQRQAMKNAAKMERANESDSGYCNSPRNLRLIDINEGELKKNEIDDTKIKSEVNNSLKDSKNYVPSIIRTQDNYVNMPRQKNDLRKEIPASFSNPSYIMMGNRELHQTGV